MKKYIGLGLAALIGATSAAAIASPQRVGDFALLDQKGKMHQLSRYRHKQAVVLLSQANQCDATADAVTGFKQLRDQWADKDVAFMVINSESDQELEAVRAAAEKQGLDFPVLLDDNQLVAETLKVSQAGEAVILDPDTFNLLYRGSVAGLNGTLDKAVANELDDTVTTKVSGCALSFPAREMHAENVPDYARDVAPIIKNNCAECHREGGIGPFAMNSHMMLKGWSPMIRETLMTKRMPPTQVDPYINHFTNARYISAEDLQTLVHWIDSGSPRGDEKAGDPLVGLEWPDLRDWQLGEPDYIVEAPVHDVPATGVIDYITEEVELTFDEDKWVKAVQFVPGDPAVLHHLLTYVTAPSEAFEGGEGDTRSIARRFLEGYAPGKIDSMTFPDNTGVYIPKGYKLSMQFHYTTNGKATTDATLLGLYFHDEPPAHEYLNRSVSGRFKVPPYSIEHQAAAEYVFEDDVMIHGLRAHMHFRGKYMRFSAELPDGTMKDLLNVPNYSYAWQPTYALEEPVMLPAGTKVHVTGAFDNSEYNPANPDPSKELTFGLQSWDEMFIGYWSYHTLNESDTKPDLEGGELTQQ